MPKVHCYTMKMLLFVLFIFMWNNKDGGLANDAPKIMLPDATVRALKGYKLSCTVNGTPPINTTLMWNNTVMSNATNVATIELHEEGKYTCEATNQYGSDTKEFSVKFTDCGSRCSQGNGEWYSHWGNTLSCNNVLAPKDIMNCAPTIADVLYLTTCTLNDPPVEMFSGCTSVLHLFMVSSNIRILPEDIFNNLTNMVQLDLSGNIISTLPGKIFSNLPQLNSLNLSSNNIDTIDPETFSTLTSLTYLSLSYNKIKKPHGMLFANLTNLEYLDLSYNSIDNLTDTLFCCVDKLAYLFLQHNQIPGMTSATFRGAINLKYLLLGNNNIDWIPREGFKYHRKLEILVLNDNKLSGVKRDGFGFGNDSPPGGLIIYMIRTDIPELNLYSFFGVTQQDSHELIMNDELIGTVRYYTKSGKDLCKIYLNPNASNTEMISVSAKIYEKARLTLVTSFLELGFVANYKYYNDANETWHYKLLPCPEGTYSLGSKGCQECPPGGFLSDSASYVADQCQPCPVGAFVKLDIYPGTRHKHCRACPRGTNTDKQAGLTACRCLDGFFRTNIFEKCQECKRIKDHEGLECKKDFLNLKSGYWWEWQNQTHKERYGNFTSNLLSPVASFDNSFRDFTHPMPKATKCPREESCPGGVASLKDPCQPGYTGPVCGICKFGYYKQLQACSKCPTKKLMAIQLGILCGFFFIIVCVLMWYSRKNVKKAQGRALIDIVFARLKIIIGFYQVTYGLLGAFSFVKWPDALDEIARYSEILQLNLLQIAPLHCLFSSLHVDAFGSLFASMGLNAAAIGLFGLIYGIRYLIISASRSLDEAEKAKRISHTKELVYRNLFFFLFVTYLSTCSKTANVLPLACRRLCRDKGENLCDDYLKADYAIRCHGSSYNLYLIGAYLNLIYIFALPAISITVLWRERLMIKSAKDDTKYQEPRESKEMVTGLRFLYENYSTPSWYWELIEMARKITLTSGLILVGQESRAYVGVTCVMAGLYGMLFAYIAPIQDYFENKLMVTSLAVTFINLGIGAVSRIPAENREPSKDPLMDTVIFKITVLGANTLVIGQLIVEYISYILRFLREWIKQPHFSFACCQSLLLPVNDLRDDAVFDEDEQQMEDGEMEMLSIHSDPAGNEYKTLSSVHPAAKENEAFNVDPVERENDAYAIVPAPLVMDKEARMLRVSHTAARVNKAFTRPSAASKANEALAGQRDHLAIDVLLDETEGEDKDVEGGQGDLDQDTEADEEEVEVIIPVEMCDQETQTDLTTLDMDDATLYELFGEPQDEALGSEKLVPDDIPSDDDGFITDENELEPKPEPEPEMEEEEEMTSVL